MRLFVIQRKYNDGTIDKYLDLINEWMDEWVN